MWTAEKGAWRLHAVCPPNRNAHQGRCRGAANREDCAAAAPPVRHSVLCEPRPHLTCTTLIARSPPVSTCTTCSVAASHTKMWPWSEPLASHSLCGPTHTAFFSVMRLRCPL